MYAALEINETDILNTGDDSVIKIDSDIQSLSWMSKSSFTAVANSITANKLSEEEARLQKFLYYQEGWLATGNTNFMVGCTFTTTLTEKQNEFVKQRDDKLLSSAKKAAKIETSESEPTTSTTVTTTSEPSATESQTLISNTNTSTATNTTSSNNAAPATTLNTTTTTTTTTNTTANTSASVPATQTATTQTTSNSNINLNRTNFNLRGHKSEIKLVRWNEVIL